MKRVIYLPIFLILFSINCLAQVKIENTLCENRSNPIGLDTKQPRFSWQLTSAKRNTKQTAYEIHVGSDLSKLAKSDVWNSGKVSSDQSVFIPFAGSAIASGATYFWQVRVWDNNGKVTPWSTPAFWQMGLLNSSDWKAKWITTGVKGETEEVPNPYFRKKFTVVKKIRHATAFITSHGLYEASINGKRVGNAYLTPGWTSYTKRLQYQQYDVTPMLANGSNAVGAVLGNGWYKGNIGFSGQRNYYGKDLAFLFQLAITYTDGTAEYIVSDETWKTSTGSILSAEIYHGETQDARKEKVGWNLPDYPDADWQSVTIRAEVQPNLIATYNEMIAKHETFKPIRIFKSPKGEQLIDFGQNLVGWVQVKVKGGAGDKIILSHAEVLDKHGNFYTENLRSGRQQDIYILKGGAEEAFEPHFTFQGFRYIKIEGYPREITSENFTAVALYSDLKPTGNFTSSNLLINQLQHNIQWGQRGNFLDVPTDCPQRDERLGWTGDAQAFSRTATFNFRVDNFFSKWLKDLALDQVDGSVPFVIPNVLGPNAAGSAGWADAGTIIPWNMYLAYGDKRILEDQYESMKAWVGFMEKNSTNFLWNKGFHFGDWLFYRPFDDNDGRSAVTDKYLIAQCFFAHSTELLLKTATVLGKSNDVTTYSELLKKVKEAFVKEYMTPNGRLVSGTQTAFALALNFDMLPEALRQSTAEKLVQNIKSYDNHITTGFLGAPYLCHVLSRFGHTDLAYTLLMQESYPSWLYPVKMGATTIWERWDGIKPDSTFQTPGMNSFNHYAYGAIGDWMYRVVCGIDTYENAPGYKHIIIRPSVGGGLTYANADLITYYGKVASQWKTGNGKLNVVVEIPSNTSATVYLPASSASEIMESDKPLVGSKDMKVSGTEGGFVILEVGSGRYSFTMNAR